MEVFIVYDVNFSYVKGVKSVCVYSTSCKMSNLHPWCSQWHLCL